jgi:transposase
MSRTVLEKVTTKSSETLYLALELSGKNWKVAMCDGGVKIRWATVAAGAVGEVVRAAKKGKEKLGLGPGARVLSCYEAGRDGFWIHRGLLAAGVENVVVDPSSIEVDRRQRRAKTDRLDAQKLVQQLVRHAERGDRLRTVRVPSPEEEDARRMVRELLRLKKERQAHVVRMKSLLALHGLRCKAVKVKFVLLVEALRQPNGEPLPPELVAELKRESERLELVRTQIHELEKARRKRILEGQSRAAQVAGQLMKLRGVADNAASIFAWEFFGWRKFENRRQVGASAGMVGAPYASGAVNQEQGITKAGNRRVRAISIELAWAWLWYQPESALSRWYTARFGDHGGRMRRVGIVALGRKLLVALWRYAEQGLIPEGALMKA